MAACFGPAPTPVPSSAFVPTAAPSSSPVPSASPIATLAPSPSPTPAALVTRCPGTDNTPGASAGRLATGSSANWSGYVAVVKKTGATCVEASWIEPAVTCPKTGHQAVAIWIGIDGFSSQLLGIPSTTSLIQIGTQADCNDGQASHGGWHEVLPTEPHEVPIFGALHAGDHITARILFAGGLFVMTLVDPQASLAFTLSEAAPGAPRHSAEWIVEAPATDCPGTCRPVPLPKFTPVTFTGAHATINGHRAAINDDHWTHVRLGMSRSGIVRTKTSGLSAGGTSFRVTWVHA